MPITSQNNSGKKLWKWLMLVRKYLPRAYSQSGYPKGRSNGKMIAKDYFEFLLHLLFHDYNGLVYDYN
jgi:hypothetical protein